MEDKEREEDEDEDEEERNRKAKRRKKEDLSSIEETVKNEWIKRRRRWKIKR